MSKPNNDRHPLSERHFKQIVCRPVSQRRKMHSVWGLTWRPGSNRASFAGNLFRPLGAAVLMVQASYPIDNVREGIALAGIGTRIDPRSALVSYDETRLQHDFHRVPFVGARGSILDPSEDQRGRRGNGSWVQLALEVDAIRSRVTSRAYRLPVIPQLPCIYVGYSSPDRARYVVNEELRQRAASSISVDWQGDSLRDLRDLSSGRLAQQRVAFDALPPATQDDALRAAWLGAFIPPDAEGNTTNLWLLPHELSQEVYSAVRVYEYFGDLVGAHVFNPARLLKAETVANPAITLAAENGIDLVADLALLAGTSEGETEYREIEGRIVGLVPAFRQRVNASVAIDDQDLLAAICCHERPVAITPPLHCLPETEQIALMRGAVKPHVNECCSDNDLLDAIRNPNGPLFASSLCKVQTMHRNASLPLSESLSFTSCMLGRARIEARLWQDRRPTRELPSKQDAALLVAA